VDGKRPRNVQRRGVSDRCIIRKSKEGIAKGEPRNSSGLTARPIFEKKSGEKRGKVPFSTGRVERFSRGRDQSCTRLREEKQRVVVLLPKRKAEKTPSSKIGKKGEKGGKPVLPGGETNLSPKGKRSVTQEGSPPCKRKKERVLIIFTKRKKKKKKKPFLERNRPTRRTAFGGKTDDSSSHPNNGGGRETFPRGVITPPSPEGSAGEILKRPEKTRQQNASGK